MLSRKLFLDFSKFLDYNLVSTMITQYIDADADVAAADDEVVVRTWNVGAPSKVGICIAQILSDQSQNLNC